MAKHPHCTITDEEWKELMIRIKKNSPEIDDVEAARRIMLIAKNRVSGFLWRN